MTKDLKIIGSNASVEFIGHGVTLPAKIDTGADSSSLWATSIHIDQKGQLNFVLFGEGFEHYTGEIIKSDTFKVASIRSASGHVEIRYRVEMSIRLGGKRIKTLFNLSNRASHKFPVLIGRRTLANKFLVNVSDREFERPTPAVTQALNEEMRQNPYEFHRKYHTKDS